MNIDFRLQEKQELFLANEADITIGGGAAGGGKTWALLLEPLRHFRREKFNSIMMRRTYPEITKSGGVWDEADKIYPLLGGVPNQGRLEYVFPHSKIGFGHINNEQTLTDWKSSQISLLMFDQLETFSERMFFYMLSRNRGTSGVRSYVRATANPEPNWLAKFLSWWIADDGYANLDRAGKVRAFWRKGEENVWADSKAEILEQYPNADPKTVSFVPFTIYDNPILMGKDPGYLASLQILPYVDRERLLGHPVRGGNWLIKPSAGKVFNADWFEIVHGIPDGGIVCRYFDFAGTEKQYLTSDPDYTAGVKMLYVENTWYIIDLFHRQIGASSTDRITDEIFIKDAEDCVREGRRYLARWEIEPGSASLRDSTARVGRLKGLDAKGVHKSTDKLTAWKPVAAQAEIGRVKVLASPWAENLVGQLHGVPDIPHDDIADAVAGAFTALVKEINTPKARSYQG